MSGPFAIFRKPLSVTRYAPGAYVDGFWVEGAPSTIQITASVQPASAEDMQTLPEGRRLTGAYRLFTDDTLFVADGQQQADVVQIDGHPYETMTTAHWHNGIVPHRSYLVSRVVEGT